eukprot:12854760-Alexandrium_andersonii.AAC.1
MDRPSRANARWGARECGCGGWRCELVASVAIRAGEALVAEASLRSPIDAQAGLSPALQITFDGAGPRGDASPAGAAAVAWLPGEDGVPVPCMYLVRCLPPGTSPLAAEGAAAGLVTELVWQFDGPDRRVRAIGDSVT